MSIRWEPRWPCFAIGFYKYHRNAKRYGFSIIIWSLVIDFGGKND